MNQLLAVGETAAHLEVLVLRGQLARVTSPEGVDFYSAPSPWADPGPAVGRDGCGMSVGSDGMTW